MQLNLQDAFLAAVKKENQVVIIYLAKGVQLKGHVKGYDNFTVFLEDTEGRLHMIYKHSITTVSPSRPMATAFMSEAFGAVAANRAAGPAPR